jgi:hypothetical protein
MISRFAITRNMHSGDHPVLLALQCNPVHPLFLSMGTTRHIQHQRFPHSIYCIFGVFSLFVKAAYQLLTWMFLFLLLHFVVRFQSCFANDGFGAFARLRKIPYADGGRRRQTLGVYGMGLRAVLYYFVSTLFPREKKIGLTDWAFV